MDDGRNGRRKEERMFTSGDDGQICMNVIIIMEKRRKGTMKMGHSAAKHETASPGSNREYYRVSDWILRRRHGSA